MRFPLLFWVFLSVVLVLLEICLRLNNNRLITKSNQIKDRLSQKWSNLNLLNIDPNMSQDELKKLAVEYNEHVKLCVAQYGNWASAIKSENLQHMPNFSGEFLNVVGGLRVTADAPKAIKQRFFIFGGSTVFCGEVSDKFTLCSQIQAEINQHKFSTAVVNFGRHGSTLQNRVIYLKLCDLRKEDLVLFWFGVNELGWKLLEGKTNLHWFPRIFFIISQGLKSVSRFLALLMLLSNCFDLFFLQPFFQTYAFLETKRSLGELQKLAQIKGFRYKVILQPNLLTKLVRSPREEAMYEFFVSKDKGRIMKIMLDGNYPRFKGLLDRLNGDDASEIFTQTDQEVFADWVHLNTEGNRISAKFIFDSFNAAGSFNDLD